ncbi:AMP-binding protein [Luteimonas pelagia]
MTLLSPAGPLARLYRLVPTRLRDAFASVHGLRSDRLRYGGSFASRLEGYRARDAWPLERLAAWQDERLVALLRHAVAHVPYYRRLHRAGGFPIEQVASAADLAKLPILEKDTIRRDPEAFVAERASALHVLHTSGTTGTPLRLYRSTETIRDWYACFERRAREWGGVSRGDRYAMLGGQLVVPVEASRPPFWVYNAPSRQLYMSVYHLSPAFMGSYLDEIARRGIVHMYGYASAMDSLASHALATGRRDVRLKLATSNAEPLYAHQRERIGKAFDCEVRDTYSNSEMSIAAFECPGGRMHLSMDVAAVEVVDGVGRPRPPGEVSDFVGTCLLNFDQPLIRYRMGDRGALAGAEAPCTCGCRAPSLDSIEGRQDDVLVTPDGRQVGRLDPVFKGGMHLLEAQVVQVALDEVHVNVVPAPGYGAADAESIAARLRDRMGGITVRVVEVPAIARTSNGKFRAVVSQLRGDRATGAT